jgi:hypothetical protein
MAIGTTKVAALGKNDGCQLPWIVQKRKSLKTAYLHSGIRLG